MNAARIERAEEACAAPFRLLREPSALAAAGLFAAEGRLVIERLLGPASRFRMRALLATPRALAALAPALERAAPEAELFAAEQDVLQAVVGHALHRGCVGLAERGAPAEPAALIAAARAAGRALLVCENVADPDNLGGLFRNAAAFGAGGVLLSPGGGDPLYRKAVRASMGASLEVPFARLARWPDGLREISGAGYRLVALAPRAALAIDALPPAPASALLLGSEAEGLSAGALAAADVAVRIPIVASVDSLNVATAAAVALHRLRRRPPQRARPDRGLRLRRQRARRAARGRGPRRRRPAAALRGTAAGRAAGDRGPPRRGGAARTARPLRRGGLRRRACGRRRRGLPRRLRRRHRRARSARCAATRFLLTSSTSVYGQDAGEWVDEASPTEPASVPGPPRARGRGARARAPPGGRALCASAASTGRAARGSSPRRAPRGLAPPDGPPRYTNRIHRDDAAGALAHLLGRPRLAPVYVGVDCEPAAEGELQRWLAARVGAPVAGRRGGRGRRSGGASAARIACCSPRAIVSVFRPSARATARSRTRGRRGQGRTRVTIRQVIASLGGRAPMLATAAAGAGVRLELRSTSPSGKHGKQKTLRLRGLDRRPAPRGRARAARTARRPRAASCSAAGQDVMWLVDHEAADLLPARPAERRSRRPPRSQGCARASSRASSSLTPEQRAAVRDLLGELGKPAPAGPLPEYRLRERGELGRYAEIACARHDVLEGERAVAELCLADYGKPPLTARAPRRGARPRRLPAPHPRAAGARVPEPARARALRRPRRPSKGLPLHVRSVDADGRGQRDRGDEARARERRPGALRAPRRLARSWIPPFR